MKTIHRAVGCAVVLSAMGLLAGCGMSPKAEAPSSNREVAPTAGTPGTALTAEEDGAGEPATLADAEALLEKARADLNRLALNEPVAPPAAAGAASPPPASVQVAPAPSPAPPRDEARRAEKSSSASADAAPAAPAKEASSCEMACKAFSSLTRASDAVCRLDTDGGKRCERARQIREDASHRVASCGCAR